MREAMSSSRLISCADLASALACVACWRAVSFESRVRFVVAGTSNSLLSLERVSGHCSIGIVNGAVRSSGMHRAM